MALFKSMATTAFNTISYDGLTQKYIAGNKAAAQSITKQVSFIKHTYWEYHAMHIRYFLCCCWKPQLYTSVRPHSVPTKTLGNQIHKVIISIQALLVEISTLNVTYALLSTVRKAKFSTGIIVSAYC